jgi:hypothetical protein
VTRQSSNTGVATVASDGIVTAVAEGPATITCQVQGHPASATGTVTVRRPLVLDVAPSGVQLSPAQTRQLVCTVRHGVTTQILTGVPLTWSSSQPSVATVDANGLVTAVAVGSATITCRATGRPESATAVVNVVAGPPPAIGLLPGNYSASGPKRSDSCPDGTFPNSINNPGPIPVQNAMSGSLTNTIIDLDTQIVGFYNAMTGVYDGSGSAMQPNQLFIQRVNGTFRQGTFLEMVAQLTNELRTLGGNLICMAIFDVIFRKTG